MNACKGIDVCLSALPPGDDSLEIKREAATKNRGYLCMLDAALTSLRGKFMTSAQPRSFLRYFKVTKPRHHSLGSELILRPGPGGKQLRRYYRPIFLPQDDLGELGRL